MLTGFNRSAPTVSGWSVAIGVPKAGLISRPSGRRWKRRCGPFCCSSAAPFSPLISARIADSIRALRDPGLHQIEHTGPAGRAAGRHPEVDELGRRWWRRTDSFSTHGERDLRRRIERAGEEERLASRTIFTTQTGQGVTAAILELGDRTPCPQNGARSRPLPCESSWTSLARCSTASPGMRPHLSMNWARPRKLRELVADWGKHGINADFHCTDPELDRRSNEIRTTVYRVIQEGLTNIARHARDATNVSVVIGVAELTLYLTIEDNGRGFDPSETSPRLGLAGMRERLLLVGGRLAIESSESAGTTIFARIPLREKNAA